MFTYIFKTPKQRLLPSFPAFRMPQGSAFPIISDISGRRGQLVEGYTEHAVVASDLVAHIQEGQHCAMARKRYGSEVVNERGVYLCDEVAGWGREVVSYSLFELV